MTESSNRLTFDSFIDEAKREFGSPDTGFWRTAWLMATRPGRTIAEVWRRERPELSTPLRFFLTTYTLYALAYVSTGAMDLLAGDIHQQLVDSVNASYTRSGGVVQISAEQVREMNPLVYYIRYPLAYEFVVLGLMLLATFPAFARTGVNLAERLSLTMYTYGFINLIQIPLVVFYFTDHRILVMSVTAAAMAVYLAWTAATLKSPANWRWGLRGVGWWLAMQLFAAVLFGLMAGVVGAKVGYAAAKAAEEAKRAEQMVQPAP
jgi:hypothetical protein